MCKLAHGPTFLRFSLYKSYNSVYNLLVVFKQRKDRVKEHHGN